MEDTVIPVSIINDIVRAIFDNRVMHSHIKWFNGVEHTNITIGPMSDVYDVKSDMITKFVIHLIEVTKRFGDLGDTFLVWRQEPEIRSKFDSDTWTGSMRYSIHHL